MKNLLIFTLLFSPLITLAQPAGYSYGKQLLVNSAQVSGATNLTDFQMLVSFTDTDLRTIANGGHVSHANGYDIIFTLADCGTVLDHQIEKYIATTGEYIAWVKIPTLLVASNTNIHMYYGNAAVSTDPSSTSVWGVNYAAVYHMNQSPAGASPQLIDYSANTNNGIANGSMVAADLITGKIGDAIDFDGTNDFFDCGNDASTDPNLDITVSAWIYSRSASGHVINRGGGWNDNGYSLFHLNNTIRIELQRNAEKDIVDNGISINTWHYVALTYNNTTKAVKCFIDGVAQASVGNHTGPMGLPVENLNIGRKEQNAFYFNGIIDEGRVIMADKNDDWLLTEYNNQNSPATFYTKSIEYTAVNLCITLPVELLYFTATKNNNHVLLKWRTESEINNDFFDIEKSKDGLEWIKLKTIKGAGNSSSPINYNNIDKHPYQNTSYYRLKQVDYNGDMSYTRTISVQMNSKLFESDLIIYPNPSNNIITIFHPKLAGEVIIYSITGQALIKKLIESNSETLDISEFASGLYIVETNVGKLKFSKR